MSLRRRIAVALSLTAMVGTALTGCSGEDGTGGAGGPVATATPTALGDRPLVEVISAGGEESERRVLALALAPGSTQDVTLEVAQEIVVDQTPQVVPTLTVPFALTVGAGPVEDAVSASWVYAEPVVDETGSSPAAAQQVEEAVASLTGATSELVVRPDGTAVGDEADAATATGAAAQVEAEVRDFVVVLPGAPIGVGARWSVASVVAVDGALLDRVATYTLQSLERDAYVIDVTIEQTYRPGEVQGVELRSGRSTVDGRLEGTLDRLLPTRASGSVSTQVSYVADQRATEVRTTVTLTLTSS